MTLLIAGVSFMLCLAMTFAWLLQRILHNAGWVDVVWTFGLGTAGITDALATGPEPSIPTPRQWLIAVLVALWSLRLGVHLARRSRRGPEDARYAQFRRDWGRGFEFRLFWLLQLQSAVAALLALTILLASRNTQPSTLLDGGAVLLLLIALGGEALADAQLRTFTAEHTNAGKVCSRGLWRWSRHPNYFFEWLAWLAYALLAIAPQGGYPLGLWALLAPAFMYVLLRHVSGVPPLERHMLRTRGKAYSDYKAVTPAFFPRLPRLK